jgi:hypothetical protein
MARWQNTRTNWPTKMGRVVEARAVRHERDEKLQAEQAGCSMSSQVTDFEREEGRASGRAVRLSGTGHERDGVLPVPVPSQWPRLASPPRADGDRGERGYAHRAAGLHLPAHGAQARQTRRGETDRGQAYNQQCTEDLE